MAQFGCIKKILSQKSYWNKFKNPDFVSICNGMGANAKRVKNVEDFFHFLKNVLIQKKFL